MARAKKTRLKVEYTLEVEPECCVPVRGNAMASGDDVLDKKVEDEILARLEWGDVWAWCTVIVTAQVEIDGEVFRGRDSLGCCSYKDEKDFKHPEGYYPSMCSEAFDDLMRSVYAARQRGIVAQQYIPQLEKLAP